MGAKNILPSELAAIVATSDPYADADGAQNSDWVDMADFESLMAMLLIGTFPDTGSTMDFKLQQATTSGGAGVKDITGKAITQIASGSPAVSDKQAIKIYRYRWGIELFFRTSSRPAAGPRCAAIRPTMPNGSWTGRWWLCGASACWDNANCCAPVKRRRG